MPGKSRSQIGRMAKNKGKEGEREVAALLRKFGFTARRGQQFAGGGDSPDVVSDLEGFHIEVKRTETFAMWAALDQAMRDMKPGLAPLVFHRKNMKPWIVVMTADDLLALLRDYVFERNGGTDAEAR